MRWHDFKLWEKIAIVVLGLWFTLGWFVAMSFPNPALFMAVPMLIIIGVLAIIWVVLTLAGWLLGLTAWLLRALGH